VGNEIPQFSRVVPCGARGQILPSVIEEVETLLEASFCFGGEVFILAHLARYLELR